MDPENDINEPSPASAESFPIAEERRAEKRRRLPVRRQLTIALALLAMLFGSTYIPGLWHRSAPGSEVPAPADTSTSLSNGDDPFAKVKIGAKSAYVWDVNAQRALYNKNADEQLPLASVAKLMTTLVAYELLGTHSDVGIPMIAIKQEGDSGLLDTERFSARNLTDFTLVSSSNDGAFALAAAGENLLADTTGSYTFLDAMNMRADELGLSQTYFENPTGLDLTETKSGAYGSARDVAYLMEYLVTTHPDILEMTRDPQTNVADDAGLTHAADNTNEVVEKIPGLIASKTGYTTLAGGNLVVAFDAGLNHPVIVAVLGSSSSGRFADTLTLVNAARAALAEQ
jgi:D-alanyl-D-alanine carboxypeptidase